MAGETLGPTAVAVGKKNSRISKVGTERERVTNENPIMDKNSERKPRKKRKTFSCALCRKFKTRCDFEPLVGKCHRCNVLQLDCSLTQDREDEILAAIEESSKSVIKIPTVVTSLAHNLSREENRSEGSAIKNPLTKTLNNRLNRLEEGFNSITGKLDLLLMLLQDNSTTSQYDPLSRPNDYSSDEESGNSKNNDLESPYRKKVGPCTKLKETPLKLIRELDERLFPTRVTSEKDIIEKRSRPFVVARVNFMAFFERHKKLCLELSKEFLVRSHFWIIPGGIKEINDEYATEHVFITSVFTIIAMSFDDNEKYAEEQEVLYPLVERLLTNTLTMFDKLIPHDIEAILYCCMFNVSRKTKRHRQLQFNPLMLSNFAIDSLLFISDFDAIKERVLDSEKYEFEDLYYLRILNSLTACKLEYSICYGNFSPLDSTVKDLNNLTAKFPQAIFGDDIKISEINLGDIVNSLFINFGRFFIVTKSNFLFNYQNKEKDTEGILIFPEFGIWLKNWHELLSKDEGGVLQLTYDFYHVVICRSFLSEYLDDMKDSPQFLKYTLNTMREHSFALLRSFLKLPPFLIRGAPILTTHQIVYACLALCDYLHWFENSHRQMVLNICTRVYWHMNTIGEKMNEATDNVGKIIKSLIDSSKYRVNMQQYSILQDLPENPKSLKSANPANSPESTHSLLSSVESTSAAFTMPDVEQFNTFEDFFQDFFDNLKPNSRSIFATANQAK
ncbi:ZYBA0S14-02256g1_1 [Zygosaccharomyces bailii CLIB 213]|uniref:ZYBA0S14-02256g1_1 n=1 Tax=Zygosaccharomyces bailii (strain CLIB 213 / ATCC 58445 / CBS 680 / BCRC 21525 / NBRC 1098 / NCYC 1416 / NRRL Y-2227) TaxID=1333698 RepID=A0A8J2XB53_ZYGB2|nr:ZYBA0S14-02256g1_1 [Zygosaccharomyces bailii CLIB 213]